MKSISVRLCDLKSPDGFQTIVDRCGERLDHYPDVLAAALLGRAIEESLLHSDHIAKDKNPYHSQSIMVGTPTDPELPQQKKYEASDATFRWLRKSIATLQGDGLESEADVFVQASLGYLSFLHEQDEELWDKLDAWQQLFEGHGRKP